MESLPHNPKVFEINTRVWLRRFDTVSHKATLADVPHDIWDQLAQQGIHIVWLMGVWKTNRTCVEKYAFSHDLVKGYREALPDWRKDDVIGSPFAIDDYALNAEVGTADNLERLRGLLHRRGIRLMLDFIPNHFSADSHLIKQNPEIFMRGTEALQKKNPLAFYKPEGMNQVFAHGRDPHFPPWEDTIQVNYFVPAARQFMTRKLLDLTVVCDGVRSDMSMLMMNEVFQNTWGQCLHQEGYSSPEDEFWPQTISAIKTRHPDFIFLAEAYWGKEWTLLKMGFDFTYDKTLTDLIRHKTAQDIYKHVSTTQEHQTRAVHFLENHDEERAITAFGKARALAGAVTIGTLPGMRFYHDGQFEGKRIRLPIQLGREPKETKQKAVEIFYNQLLQITKEPVFMEGTWQLLYPDSFGPQDNSYRDILGWLWHREHERRLVAINLSETASRCRLKLDVRGWRDPIEFIDLLSDKIHRHAGHEVQETGLTIELRGYQSCIFKF